MSLTKSTLILFAVAASLAAISLPREAKAADEQIRFENHHFTPQSLTVPSGQVMKVTVVNSSDETIEFESFKLNREQSVEPGQTITVKLPALRPGTYDFYDDFHQDVPQGTIVAQ